MVQRKTKDYAMRSAIAYTVLALAIAGCAKTSSEDILPPACMNFQRAMEDNSVNVGHHFESAIAALRGITNSELRAACYVRWIDELCALDVSNLDYNRQAYCIDEVLDATRNGGSMLDDCMASDSWLEVVVDSWLKGLSWGRKQIDRLKPTMPTGSSYDYGKIDERTQWNSSEYSQWQNCYSTAWWSYHTALRLIEGEGFGEKFDSQCLGFFVSPMAREKAKKKIEEFLGRKMRTEAECERDSDEEKAKMKAVSDGKIGPDLKKLRPVEMGK